MKHAFRQLLKTPGFTTVAVCSLAIGIGACTAVFSAVEAILLRSLPVPHSQDLRVLRWTGTDSRIPSLNDRPVQSGRRTSAHAVSHPMFLGLREQAAALADVFGFIPIPEVAAQSRGEAVVARGVLVSDNFFSGLGVRPFMGRLFAPGDDDGGAAANVVIAHEWWERHFARDPDVIGRTVTLSGGNSTIVGVLPRGFDGVRPGEPCDFYAPMSARAQFFREPFQTFTSDRHWWVRLMARLKTGGSDAQLQAVLTTIFARGVGTVLGTPEIVVAPGRGGLAIVRDSHRKPLLLLMGVVGMVMLVACANLAGLSLARAAGRQHELAVRAALGASRGRLIRLSLAESVVLAVLGAGLGALVAGWTQGAIARFLAESSDRLRYDLSLNLPVLSFTVALALATALLSGLLPAVRAARADPIDGLKARGSLGAPRMRIGKVLVAAQIALSLVLLAGAGLYVRTLANLRNIDTGFATEKLLVFQLSPTVGGYDAARLTALYENTQQALAALPGVLGATFVQYPLLNHKRWGIGFSLPGRRPSTPTDWQAHRLTIGESFFATLGIPIVQGRTLRDADTNNSFKAAVINETFARKFFPNENPLDQSVKIHGVDWRIVGVCGDAKYDNLKDAVPPTVYMSFRQYSVRYDPCFAVRTALSPLTFVTAVRKTVAAIDPQAPIAHITTQDALRDGNISQERLFATLCSALAAVAVLLSCLGLYGLMAYRVTSRRSEIAIRMAIGAQPRDVALSFLREALLLCAIGAGVGLPAVLIGTRLIKNQLYGVSPHDPASLAIALCALVAIALLAVWLPARRATRVDPISALRAD